MQADLILNLFYLEPERPSGTLAFLKGHCWHCSRDRDQSLLLSSKQEGMLECVCLCVRERLHSSCWTDWAQLLTEDKQSQAAHKLYTYMQTHCRLCFDFESMFCFIQSFCFHTNWSKTLAPLLKKVKHSISAEKCSEAHGSGIWICKDSVGHVRVCYCARNNINNSKLSLHYQPHSTFIANYPKTK